VQGYRRFTFMMLDAYVVAMSPAGAGSAWAGPVGAKLHLSAVYKKTGKCPLVYETARMNRLHLEELKKLFPAGYLRGACKLAGITHQEGYMEQSGVGFCRRDYRGQGGENVRDQRPPFSGQSFPMGRAVRPAQGLGNEDAQAHR
jgi:hypothetical protein